MGKQVVTDLLKKLIKQLFDLQDKFIQNEIKDSIRYSRFLKNINEFNRSYGSINRTAIAFPVSTIPTEVETKVRTFSIFIGSFNVDDLLDNNSDILNYAKIFYSSLGKLAAESASEAVM